MTSNKELFNISYPIALTLVAQNILNVTDTAFLGRVGEVALGGSAIAGVFFFALYIVGFGFSQGVQILIGRRNGEKKLSDIGPIFHNGMVFNVLLALLFVVIVKMWDRQMLTWMVGSPDILNASLEYLDWRIYGLIFAFINVIFRAFFVGITQTRVLTISAFITTGVNVVLDYLLIFGHYGFPEMGIAGAAFASMVAEAVTSVYLFAHTLTKDDFQLYHMYKKVKIMMSDIKQILNLSIFTMFQFFISIASWFVFFLIIERMGERALAATNLGRSLYFLLMIPGLAISTTVNTVVSNLIGAGEKDKVMRFVFKMTLVSIVLILPFMLFTFFFPELFARIYTDNPDLIAASLPVLKIVSIANVFCAFGSTLFNAVSGTGNTNVSFVIEIFTLLFYLTYVYLTAIVYNQSLAVVWMSELVYWTIIGSIAWLYLLTGRWKHKEI